MQAKVHLFVYYDDYYFYYLHDGLLEPQKGILILDFQSPGG